MAIFYTLVTLVIIAFFVWAIVAWVREEKIYREKQKQRELTNTTTPMEN
jgi:hypothetical protein